MRPTLHLRLAYRRTLRRFRQVRRLGSEESEYCVRRSHEFAAVPKPGRRGKRGSCSNFPKRNLSEVTCVLVDPSDSNHYMAGIISADGGGLFDSPDEGRTWTAVKGVENFGVRSIVAAPSKPTRFISGTLHGVMLSDDSGKTWTRISDPQNAEMQGITAVAVDPQNPDIIYAGTSHLPWKTTDGGKTWESIHNGMIDDSDVFSLIRRRHESGGYFRQRLQRDLRKRQPRRHVEETDRHSKYFAPHACHP